MAKAPTYQDLNRQRADADAMQSQMTQRDSIAQNAEVAGNANINPVLAEYMSRNNAPQGLIPRNPANEYAMLAGNVAKNVPDRQTYSLAMIDAAMKGQVPTEEVLADANIPDQAKAGLINTMRQTQTQGLGQVVQ